VRAWLIILGLILFVAASAAYYRLPAARTFGIFLTDPPTPYYHYSPVGQSRGRILVVHGLDANKELMNVLCFGLAESGLDVYSIDLPGHGDSDSGFDGLKARRAVEGVLDRLGPNTAVVGHSFGASLLLDLAADRDFGSMVLLSPPTALVGDVRADRVLLIAGQFDLPPILKFIPSIQKANPEKVSVQIVPWSGHSGYAFRSAVIRDISEWLGGDPSHLRTRERMALLFAMLATSLGVGVALLPGTDIKPDPPPVQATIFSYIGAGALAYVVCGVVVILAWLRLFAMAYLISFIFIAGAAICVRRPRMTVVTGALFKSILAAAYLVVVPGLLVVSNIVHLSLSDGRWWRFAAIALAGLPLFVADEHFIRPLRPWWKSAGLALLTRLLLAGFIATGVLTLKRADAFVVLTLHLVILFWMFLWFAGEVVRRHTQDPLSTAVFCALVQGWVFAAIFVIT
jgi:alpha-beta hydrolase superfamily lysophospholipase